ncbi:MAG: hypothetical protein WBC85_08705 [Planktotalea sp.]|uniref:hypothetical protein n=1 Tax=Planktotalea sp. TaxID=2029877 RepID=UPI003C70811F
MRRVICGLILGFSGLVSGCVGITEPTFATRNAEASLDLDMQSLVRNQSNDLLTLTQALENHAKRDFSSSRSLDRDLEETITHMDQLHMNLPALLAAQDVEVAELRDGVLNGSTQKAALSERIQDVQTYRKSLLGSLNASADRANAAAQKLMSAYGAGRVDLGAQTQTAQGLARDLKAARTMIEMQL